MRSNTQDIAQFYTLLADVIAAIGDPSFASVLSGALQCVLQHDYYMLTQYSKGSHLELLDYDFKNLNMRDDLNLYLTETFFTGPIYKIYHSNKIKAGFFDLDDLIRLGSDEPSETDCLSANKVGDKAEIMQWRSLRFSNNLRESFIITPLNNERLIVTSMFKVCLVDDNKAKEERNVSHIARLVSSVISRHYSQQISLKEPGNQLHTITKDSVVKFFRYAFSVELTSREAEIFKCLLQGEALTTIADCMFISINTARTHRRNVYRKIGHGRLIELTNKFHDFLANCD